MLGSKQIKKGFLVLMAVSLCMTSYDALSSQIELSNSVMVKDVTTTQKKLLDKELTILGFVIGKSTLSDVAKFMPNKNLVQSGDAGTSNSSLCYIDAKGITLTFNSSPMGGSEKIITDISLQNDLKKSQDKAVCSQSDKINSNINIYDLKLGLGEKKVLTLKGKPNKELKDLLIYNYESSINVSENKFYISSILKLHFSNGKLIRIDLSKIESN